MEKIEKCNQINEKLKKTLY